VNALGKEGTVGASTGCFKMYSSLRYQRHDQLLKKKIVLIERKLYIHAFVFAVSSLKLIFLKITIAKSTFENWCP